MGVRLDHLLQRTSAGERPVRVCQERQDGRMRLGERRGRYGGLLEEGPPG